MFVVERDETGDCCIVLNVVVVDDVIVLRLGSGGIVLTLISEVFDQASWCWGLWCNSGVSPSPLSDIPLTIEFILFDVAYCLSTSFTASPFLCCSVSIIRDSGNELIIIVATDVGLDCLLLFIVPVGLSKTEPVVSVFFKQLFNFLAELLLLFILLMLLELKCNNCCCWSNTSWRADDW